MKIKLLLAFVIAIFSLQSLSAQTPLSPFKVLPKPAWSPLHRLKLAPKVAFTQPDSTITAWRFTVVAGYEYPANQAVTGLGFTYQKLKYIDSVQKWYTTFAVGPYIFAGGQVVPTISPFNIISVGVGVAFLNNLITIIPCYNLPVSGNKGSFGVVASFGIALNN